MNIGSTLDPDIMGSDIYPGMEFEAPTTGLFLGFFLNFRVPM